jgi:Fic-DOC domain mobile mystery protein B
MSDCGLATMNDTTEPEGATAGEDLSGLLLPHLLDRPSRDVVETELIDRAYQKYIFRARPKQKETTWLRPEFIRQVHRDMFGELWDWAGKYRTVNLNLGVDWHQIQEHVARLCGDFTYWDSEQSKMPVFEIAARLQSHLTRIHPFKNGNGRHARLITDIFFHSRKMKLPRWPQIQRLSQGDRLRKDYVAAMKKADQEDYSGLIAFFEECIQPPKSREEQGA